jgi:hypothetical protein
VTSESAPADPTKALPGFPTFLSYEVCKELLPTWEDDLWNLMNKFPTSYSRKETGKMLSIELDVTFTTINAYCENRSVIEDLFPHSHCHRNIDMFLGVNANKSSLLRPIDCLCFVLDHCLPDSNSILPESECDNR